MQGLVESFNSGYPSPWEEIFLHLGLGNLHCLDKMLSIRLLAPHFLIKVMYAQNKVNEISIDTSLCIKQQLN